MDTLQKIFEESLQSHFDFSKIGASLIQKKLGEQGLTISVQQFARIKKALDNKAVDLGKVDFLIEATSKGLPKNSGEEIHIDLSDADEEIDKIISEMENRVAEALPSFIDDISELLLKALKKESYSLIKYQDKQRASFEKRLIDQWKKPFRVLEMLLVISTEAGEDFNNEFRPQAAIENDYVFEVLTRLHARACLISSEIITLLKCGYADGAFARWRSVHEIAVISSFIRKFGKDVAERYLLHQHVESYKAAQQYQKNYETLGLEPFTDSELLVMRNKSDELINRFGKSYGYDYGWASSIIQEDNPRFIDIESIVGLDHFRPFYKLACDNIHSNPKGVFFHMGLYPGEEEILLVGPTNYGLTDPAQNLAMSLTVVTTNLILYKPNIDRYVISNILAMIRDEIGDEFYKVQEVLK